MATDSFLMIFSVRENEHYSIVLKLTLKKKKKDSNIESRKSWINTNQFEEVAKNLSQMH